MDFASREKAVLFSILNGVWIKKVKREDKTSEDYIEFWEERMEKLL